jgi:hypothetical protein
LQNRCDFAQAIHFQRRPRRRQINDDVRNSKVWGNLGGAGDWNHFDGAAGSIEEPPSHARKHGGYPSADNLIDPFYPAILARGDDEPAATEIEIQAHIEITLGLTDEVPSGNARVRCTIGDKLRDILGTNENRLELAAERCGESAFAAGAHGEPGVFEQLARLVGQASLIW